MIRAALTVDLLAVLSTHFCAFPFYSLSFFVLLTRQAECCYLLGDGGRSFSSAEIVAGICCVMTYE